MSTATLVREARQLLGQARALTAGSPALTSLRADPARILADAGMEPDLWQADLLRHPFSRTLMLASRQSGKSLTAAALGLREALLRPGSLVLLLSPSQRQSGELFR